MASGYIYRPELMRRIGEGLSQGAVVVWGPPGFGKTLLLKEAARSFGLLYRNEWGPGPGAFDLESEPPDLTEGQLLALPFRPRFTSGEVLLLGPETLAFTLAEVRELARRLGAVTCVEAAWERLGGWPLLVRRGVESGVCEPENEPLRGYLEGMLEVLGSRERGLLRLLVKSLPESAWRRAGYGEVLDALFRGGWIRVERGRVRPLAALLGYFAATAGPVLLEELEPVLTAAEDVDPEAAFLTYLEYGSPEAGRIFEKLAGVLIQAGEYEKVVVYWGELPEEHRTAMGALRTAEAERSRGRLEEALALARWARERGEVERALAFNIEGTVLIHMGRYREAVRALEEGLAVAGEGLRHKILAGLGAALIRAGDFARAVEVLQEAATLAQGTGDVELLAKVQHNLGIALHHGGRLRRAVSKYQEALELKASAPALARSNTLLSLGEALRLLGHWQEARRALLDALSLAEESGEYRAIGYAALNQGDLYLEAGWLEEAEQAYRRAEAILRPVDDRYGLGLLWLGGAGLARARGATAIAAEALDRAEAELGAGGSPLELAQVWLERARLFPDEAGRWLARAEAAAAEAGAEYHRLLARAMRVARGDLGPEAAAEVAGWVLREDVYSLALDARLFPVWVRAATAGRQGKALLEKLSFGYGCFRVYSLGGVRLAGATEIDLPTVKEGWLLLWLWLRPEEDPLELFAGVKRPRKRLQLAVHHLRSRLGEEWVRYRDPVYVSAPLPGVWWDVAMLRAAHAAATDGVSAELRDFVRRLYRGPLAPGAPFVRERRGLERTFAQLVGA